MKTKEKRLGRPALSLTAFVALLTLVAGCTGNTMKSNSSNDPSSLSDSVFVSPVSQPIDVPFQMARNYFFRNDQEIPSNPCITTQEEFNRLFGMATTMGPEGKPTPIDFSQQFVLAIILPVTDLQTEIRPLRVEAEAETLKYVYTIETGEKQTFSIQPLSLIILDKEYAHREVVLVKE